MKKDIKQIHARSVYKDGKLTAIASTEDVDRSGDSLKVKDWDFSRFLLNPVLQAGHKYEPQFTIGKAENIRIEGTKVYFDPVFHTITPLAKQLKEMYEKGFLNAWSVGFIPGTRQLKGEENGTKNELLEVSAVAVPANPFALMKGFGEDETAELVEEINHWLKGEEGEEAEDDAEAEEAEVEEDAEDIEESLDDEVAEDELAEDEEEDDIPVFDSDIKAAIEMKTGESEDHSHKATIDEKTGNGTTDVVDGHAHRIKDFKLEEVNGHTHALDLEAVQASAHKPKKKTFDAVERWNKQLPEVFNKEFDVDSINNVRMSFQNEVFTKFFGCEVKELFVNNYFVPSAMIGTELSALKELSKDFELVDTRNFHGDIEYPPLYEVIQLTIDKTDDFLVEGIQFYKVAGHNSLVVKLDVGWYGINVSLVSHNDKKEWNKEFQTRLKKWAYENNFLRGQKFALSGEFLSSTKGWDDVILEKEVKDVVHRNVLKVSQKDSKSRGLLFMGPPGTGKTMTGKIMMKESDSTFIWVSSGDMYRIGPIGAIKMAFAMARSLGPSVLFMEDIDTWLRGPAIDLLKTEMDGIRENKGLITVLTSNEPEELPDALIDRPGRFHEIIEFGHPTKSVREMMLKQWAGEISGTILEEVLEKTEGYSGAYIKELVDYAESIAEDEGVEMGVALLKSLQKLEEQRQLVQRIRQDKKSHANIVTKAGRVISQKNRNILTDARDALNKVLDIPESEAEENVKGISEFSPDEKVKTNVDTKKVLKRQPTEAEIAIRALQKIVGTANESLRASKKK